MLEQLSFRPYAGTQFASCDTKRAVSAAHGPRQNHLLAALALEDYERLLPSLEPIALPLGWTVHRAGDREKHLYFLTEGIVSKSYTTRNGASTEFTMTGREGAIGVALFLGGESALSQAVVRGAGYAYRLHADAVKNEFGHNSRLAQSPMEGSRRGSFRP
jgi:CRP-like cAMP-binding protein